MDIAKQIVDQRVNKIVEDYVQFFEETDKEKNRSKAFLLLGVAAYLDIDIEEAAQYITDGGNDGGFDAAYIVEAQDSQVNVVLFQSKYSRKLDGDSNFPANAVEKAVNTIKNIFDPSANIMLNTKSKEKVDEIRSFILDGYIPYVTFVMLNNGLTWNQDAQNHMDNAFRQQKQVLFEHFNHNNIIQYINRQKPIDTQMALLGKSVQEDFNYKRVVIGKVSVMEIFRLIEEHGDSLFEKNIRRYLGRNAVNEGIIETLLSEQNRANFFFFNNGITMICDQFSYNGLQSQDWILKIKRLQIINGGQTCKTIHQVMKDNPEEDFSKVYVLIRLYEVSDDENIINDITYATNSQNPVDFRDLKSNDECQVLLEKGVADLGLTYKRKRDNVISTNTIPSTVAAEAVFAVWRGKPFLAKYKRNEFFDKYYDEIFTDLNAAQLIVAVTIFRFCDNYRKRLSLEHNVSAQRPYSQYFLAYMLGLIILKKCDITKVNDLTHANFESVMKCWDSSKEELYHKAEKILIGFLQKYFGMEHLQEIDGRTMAAAFRRFDIIERYIKDLAWIEDV